MVSHAIYYLLQVTREESWFHMFFLLFIFILPQKNNNQHFFLLCNYSAMALNHSSPMSITQLINSSVNEDIVTTNDIQDPDLKIAAEVLGDMARLSSVKGKL